MLVGQRIRQAYWILSYLSYFDYGQFVCALTLQRDMYKKKLIQVSQICEPLVRADILEKTPGRRKTGYRLSRLPEKILLADVHKAFYPERYQETSSIALYLDKLLQDKTLANLVEYEEEDLKNLVYKIVL